MKRQLLRQALEDFDRVQGYLGIAQAIPLIIEKVWEEVFVSFTESLGTIEGHTGAVHSVAFSPYVNLVASGGNDGNTRLWRVSDGRELRTLPGTGRSLSVAFSPDGSLLASLDNDSILLRRVSDGGVQMRLSRQFMGEVNSVAFSHDGALLASGSSNNYVRLWRLSDGGLMWELRKRPEVLEMDSSGISIEQILSVAFSPNGALMASGSNDGTIRLLQVSDGRLLRTWVGHRNGVESVLFSPDGSLMASGGRDNTVRVWRVSDYTLLRTLEGHTGSVRSVAFSPNGSLLASGGNDSMILLWRVSNGKLVCFMEGHTGAVSSVAFSCDGSFLASGGSENAIRLWWSALPLYEKGPEGALGKLKELEQWISQLGRCSELEELERERASKEEQRRLEMERMSREREERRKKKLCEQCGRTLSTMDKILGRVQCSDCRG